jgi:glycine oxidase
MHTENLIVGLGLAGINLCHQLEKQGRSFVVIDPCPRQSSSLIAGGIYNPIVIKRKMKTWKADTLFPVLVDAYREMENMLGNQFLVHDFPILKPISSVSELDEWQAAIDQGAVQPFVDTVIRSAPKGPFSPSVIGHVLIQHSGFLRTDEAIGAYREHLRTTERLMVEKLDFEKFAMDGAAVRYGYLTADRVIFCEGRHISDNPYFNWLPMRPTKGQMLTVKVNDALTPDHVYNQQFYLFPTTGEEHLSLRCHLRMERPGRSADRSGTPRADDPRAESDGHCHGSGGPTGRYSPQCGRPQTTTRTPSGT